MPEIDAPGRAPQVPVTTVDGVRVPGWVVRRDLVVVQAGGLKQPISVTVDGVQVQAEIVHETTRDPADDQPWTALELPDGTLDVVGEYHPPTLPAAPRPAPPGDGDRVRTLGARVAFWCLVFPQLRGCR